MASTTSDIQKIVVSLSTADIVIEPGSTAQLIVSMTIRQDQPDRLSIEVEGIDVEWYAIPVPAVNVAPGATVTERILFKVARNSANRAGAYPFLVRVQAQETGEVGVAQAALIVKPFSFLEVELDLETRRRHLLPATQRFRLSPSPTRATLRRPSISAPSTPTTAAPTNSIPTALL